MQLLKEFFGSMFSEWLSALCGPASVPIAVIALVTSNHSQKMVYGAFAALLGFTSVFRIWRREFLRANAAEAELDTQKPRLTMKIDAVSWTVEKDLETTHIWVAVTLRNDGVPTVVSGWEATLNVGSSGVHLHSRDIGPSGARLVRDTTFLDVTDGELLIARTLERPIERHFAIKSRLHFELGGDGTHTYCKVGSKLHLLCKGSDGVECNDTYAIERLEDPLFYPHEAVQRFTKPTIT